MKENKNKNEIKKKTRNEKLLNDFYIEKKKKRNETKEEEKIHTFYVKLFPFEFTLIYKYLSLFHFDRFNYSQI